MGFLFLFEFMESTADKPYPDVWYVITLTNDFYKSNTEEGILHKSAKYYVLKSHYRHHISAAGNRYDFNEFIFFNPKFEPTQVNENGVILHEHSKEYWDWKGYGTTSIFFEISDKRGLIRRLFFSGGFEAIKECILQMHELSNFYTWEEYDLFKETEKQTSQIERLEKQTIRLTKELETMEDRNNLITSQRSNIKKLYHTLFDEEIKQGIKHIINSPQLSDKDIATAFSLSLSQVKKIKKE